MQHNLLPMFPAAIAMVLMFVLNVKLALERMRQRKWHQPYGTANGGLFPHLVHPAIDVIEDALGELIRHLNLLDDVQQLFRLNWNDQSLISKLGRTVDGFWRRFRASGREILNDYETTYLARYLALVVVLGVRYDHLIPGLKDIRSTLERIKESNLTFKETEHVDSLIAFVSENLDL